MQEEVSEQRGNRAALRCSHGPVPQGTIGHQHRSFQPSLHVDQDPFRVRVMRDRLLRQIPGHRVEERLDVHVDYPVFLKAPFPAYRDRVQGRASWPVPVGVVVEHFLQFRLQRQYRYRLRNPVDDMRFHSLYRLPRRSASNRSTVTPSAPAAPLFSFTFSHASHTSRFGISCVLPCNIGSVMWFIPSGWPHSSTRATRPLGSTRITRLRSYYGPVRQRAPRPVLSPSRFLPLGVLPLAATPDGSSGATPSHVPYESLVR